jgi:hypothetical protein
MPRRCWCRCLAASGWLALLPRVSGVATFGHGTLLRRLAGVATLVVGPCYVGWPALLHWSTDLAPLAGRRCYFGGRRCYFGSQDLLSKSMAELCLPSHAAALLSRSGVGIFLCRWETGDGQSGMGCTDVKLFPAGSRWTRVERGRRGIGASDPPGDAQRCPFLISWTLTILRREHFSNHMNISTIKLVYHAKVAITMECDR